MRKIFTMQKKICIGDYIEIILGPCKHSLCLQREGLPDKTCIVSNTFRWNEECDLLNMEKISALNFSTQLKLFIRCSAIEDLHVFLRLSVGPPVKLRIFVETLFNSG